MSIFSRGDVLLQPEFFARARATEGLAAVYLRAVKDETYCTYCISMYGQVYLERQHCPCYPVTGLMRV